MFTFHLIQEVFFILRFINDSIIITIINNLPSMFTFCLIQEVFHFKFDDWATSHKYLTPFKSIYCGFFQHNMNEFRTNKPTHLIFKFSRTQNIYNLENRLPKKTFLFNAMVECFIQSQTFWRLVLPKLTRCSRWANSRRSLDISQKYS